MPRVCAAARPREIRRQTGGSFTWLVNSLVYSAITTRASLHASSCGRSRPAARRKSRRGNVMNDLRQAANRAVAMPAPRSACTPAKQHSDPADTVRAEWPRSPKRSQRLRRRILSASKSSAGPPSAWETPCQLIGAALFRAEAARMMADPAAVSSRSADGAMGRILSSRCMAAKKTTERANGKASQGRSSRRRPTTAAFADQAWSGNTLIFDYIKLKLSC